MRSTEFRVSFSPVLISPYLGIIYHTPLTCFPLEIFGLALSISKPSPIHFESSNIARPHSELHSGRLIINVVLILNQCPRDSAGCHMHALVL